MMTIQTDEAFAANPHAKRWTDILGRASAMQSLNLDALLTADDGPGQDGGRTVFPEDVPPPFLPPLTDDRAAIGIIYRDTGEDIVALAARLAAIAIEKDCEVIVLTRQDLSGLERYGFRCERISGDTPEQEAACIAQIKAFWNMEIVI